MADEVTHIGEARCIGCGLCAYHCIADALSLGRTGQREIMVLLSRRTVS